MAGPRPFVSCPTLSCPSHYDCMDDPIYRGRSPKCGRADKAGKSCDIGGAKRNIHRQIGAITSASIVPVGTREMHIHASYIPASVESPGWEVRIYNAPTTPRNQK